MKIIVDANILVQKPTKFFQEIKDELIVPKVALNEILTNEEWASGNNKRITGIVQKIKINGYSKFNLDQPEDIILTWSEIFSLRPLPSRAFMTSQLDDLLNQGKNYQQVLEKLKRDVVRSEYEEKFVPAIKELTDKIELKHPQLQKKDKKFLELDESIKEYLRNIAKWVYTHRVSAYLRHVHTISDPNALQSMLNKISFGDNLVIDVFAAYLYDSIGRSPKKNDQFDIKYPFYCLPGCVLWSEDKLIIRLLKDHLGRGDLLYKG